MKLIVDHATPILAVRYRPGEPLGEHQLLVSGHRGRRSLRTRQEVTAFELDSVLSRLSARRLTATPTGMQGVETRAWHCKEWAEDSTWKVWWAHPLTTPLLGEYMDSGDLADFWELQFVEVGDL